MAITLEQAVSVWRLYNQGVDKASIAKAVQISRSSVIGILAGRQSLSPAAEKIARQEEPPSDEGAPKETVAKLLKLLSRETLERELLNRL